VAAGTFSLTNWGSASGSGGGQSTLPQGTILQARYEIIKVLGVGGMGAVYLAQDLRFTGVVRHCAVKEMIITTPDPQARRLATQNFNREANLLVQLSHSGIPEIYDFFTEANRSYLVMEHVDGNDLETVIENAEGMLDEATVIDWAVQVCDVLTYLHSQKPPIIFRDLKPANIMLRRQNRIALIDFGIAKAFESGQKGTMIGTEGYSPPEQYQGVASPRVDIYALGATLHHLLTKRDPRLQPPFSFHEAPPITINAKLSKETSAVIMKSLEYNPNNRYQTAQAFRDALTASLGKISTGTSPMGTQVLPPEGSNTIGQFAPSQVPPMSPPAQYPPTGYPPQYPPVGYPPQYPPANYPPPPMAAPNVVISEGDDITPIWTFKCEDEVRASPAADSKNLYIGAYDHNMYALDLKTGQFQWKYPTDGGIVTRPCISNDRVIFGSEDQVLYAITTKGRLIWTFPTQGRIRSSAIEAFDRIFFGSDDGKFYAVNGQNGRLVWAFESAFPIRSSPTMGEALVYVGTEDGMVFGLDLRTGDQKWKFRAKKAVTSSPALYQKTNMLIVGGNDRSIYGLNGKSGYEQWQVRTKLAVISSPTIVDDVAYIGSVDGNLYAIQADSGRQLWRFDAKSSIISKPAVTSEAIYFGTTDGDVISLGRDRKIRWRFKTGGAVPSSPLVMDGVVYIGSTDHTVYALPA